LAHGPGKYTRGIKRKQGFYPPVLIRGIPFRSKLCLDKILDFIMIIFCEADLRDKINKPNRDL
jgi:hypothetical protein